MTISIPAWIAAQARPGGMMWDLGSQVPGVTGEEKDQIRAYEEGVGRAENLQAQYRRLGAMGIQGEAEAGMQNYDPRMAALMGPAGLVHTRRLGQLGNIGALKGDIEGRIKAEAISPERKRETLRQRMMAAAAAAAAAGQTKELMFQTLSGMAAGDPVLLREARQIAGAQGRMAQAGTIPGYVEDIGSLLGIG